MSSWFKNTRWLYFTLLPLITSWINVWCFTNHILHYQYFFAVIILFFQFLVTCWLLPFIWHTCAEHISLTFMWQLSTVYSSVSPSSQIFIEPILMKLWALLPAVELFSYIQNYWQKLLIYVAFTFCQLDLHYCTFWSRVPYYH